MIGEKKILVKKIRIINEVKVFEKVKKMKEGGKKKEQEVMIWKIYKEGLVYMRVGYEQEMKVIFIEVIVIMMMMKFRVMERRKN